MYQFQNVPGMMPAPMANQQIIKVNGEAGANAFVLPANSSILLLDENAPRLFLAQSDGAGYKTITSYKLVPEMAQKQATLENIIERLNQLEEKMNEQSNIRNGSQAERDKRYAEKSK